MGKVKTETSLEDKLFCLEPYYSSGMYGDIKKSMITLARYKFVSKMLRHMERLRVLELGCNEGIGAYFFCNCRIVWNIQVLILTRNP